MAAAKPLDWSTYVTSGSHQPNSSLIQAINQNEPRPDLIRLGTGELSQELLPEQEMGELFREAGTNILRSAMKNRRAACSFGKASRNI